MANEAARSRWRRSQRCGPDGNCVEVASDDADAVFVRDSKDPEGPTLRFDRDTWLAFLADVKRGRFDGPEAQRPSSGEPTVQ